VTPLQLVSMVSTIANGWRLPATPCPDAGTVDHADNPQQPATSQASPFKPGGDLPNPLPPGAHRVIFHYDRGPDAQDEWRGGALRHRQAGAN